MGLSGKHSSIWGLHKDRDRLGYVICRLKQIIDNTSFEKKQIDFCNREGGS